jgi:hypothetical protein
VVVGKEGKRDGPRWSLGVSWARRAAMLSPAVASESALSTSTEVGSATRPDCTPTAIAVSYIHTYTRTHIRTHQTLTRRHRHTDTHTADIRTPPKDAVHPCVVARAFVHDQGHGPACRL